MSRILIGLALLVAQLPAQVAVDATILGDHLVLQRDRPVVLWGSARPGEAVSVAIDGPAVATVADAAGAWCVRLPPRGASAVPLSIVISGPANRVVLADVLVGDVWICAGQSNMEFPLSKAAHAREALAAADLPTVRLLNHDWAGQYRFGKVHGAEEAARLRADFFRGRWEPSTAASAAPMSAVGFFFARQVAARTRIPIGLVNWSIGGAPIETFIAREALAAHPRLAAKVRGDWLANDALPAWVRERGRQNLDRAPEVPADDLGRDHAYKPGFAFARGPGACTRFPIAGVLWYQGESNSLTARDTAEYGELFTLLVEDWRRRWQRPDLPFLWVQLSGIDTRTYQSQCWPAFRDQQRRLLATIPHGGMAVCSDCGAKDNVHPIAKQEVGERLARWALRLVHGQEVVPSGPLAQVAGAVAATVTVCFAWSAGLRSRDGQPLREFELAGQDGVFHPADAIISGDAVQVTAPAVAQPAQVRMGWRPWSTANLVNGEDLPASTFSLEIVP